MRDDTPSRTAAWVAAARQLGRLLPEDVRIADDPYGAAFTSPHLQRLIERAAGNEAPSGRRSGKRGREGSLYNEAPNGQRGREGSLRDADGLGRLRHPITALPGLRDWILYMQVRTRVIDDALRAFALGGGAQVVLLGAGYDCRALRLRELEGARVLEVDHPATQRHKRAVLDKIGVTSPASYLTWNFEERPMEDLPEALVEAGHDPGAPTFTVWEGVTMYLTEPAIDASLRAIASWSAPGSQLAMTYFATTMIRKPTFATRAIRAVVSRVGEPWRFGWDPDELPAYLEARGLELVEDIVLSEAAHELLPPDLAARVASPDRRVALAAAPESIAVARTR